MKIVRVHNPKGLRANSSRQRSNGKMATKRRRRRRNASVGRPRRVAAKTVNPRRRRRRSRRNPTTIVARSRSTRRVINPRRRRHSRRRNPSGMRIGGMLKQMVYGGGGAILTRAISSVLEGFVPGSFATSPLMRPAVQAAAAVIPVRWLGKKFMGQSQADTMMLGGLISAGLALADVYLPNLQGQLSSVFRLPLTGIAPQAVIPAAAQQALAGGYADVYDVPVLPGSFGGFHGFGDVEDVSPGIWG